MSSNTSAALRIAEQHLIQGNINEAIEVYEKVAQGDPDNLNVKNRLGELYVRADRTRAATDIFLSLARGYASSGHTLKAIAFFKKTLKLEPDNPDAYLELGSLYAGTGLVAEAESHYLQAAEIYSTSSPANAIAAYEGAIQIAGSSPELLMRLAGFCEKAGILDRAHKEYIKAGDAFAEKNDDVRALDAYDKALLVKPGSSTAADLIARVIKKLGIEGVDRADRPVSESGRSVSEPQADSVRDFASMATVKLAGTAHAPAPDDSFVVRQISKAEIMCGFGQTDEAIAVMKELLATSPDDPKVRKKLKDIYLRSGMAEKAAHEYLELARIYEAEGDKQAAAESLSSARSLCPSVLENVERQPAIRTPQPGASGPRLVQDPDGVGRSAYPPVARVEPKTPDEPIRPQAVRPGIQPLPKPDDRPKVDVKASVESKSSVEAALTEQASHVVTGPPDGAALKGISAKAVVADPVLDHLSELERPASSGKGVQTRAAAPGSFLGVPFEDAEKDSRAAGSRRGIYLALAVVLVLAAGAGAAYKLSLFKQRAPQQVAQVQQDSVAPAAPSASPDDVVVDVGKQPDAQPASTTQTQPDSPSRDQNQPNDSRRQQQQRDRMLQQQQERQQQEQQFRAAQQAPPNNLTATPVPQPSRETAAPPQVQSIGARPAGPGIATQGAPGLNSSTPTAPAPLPDRPQPRKSTGPINGRVLRRVEPAYPAAARAANITGSVSIEVTIDERGTVVGARALSGPGMLVPSALNAARGFRFSPTTLDGMPTKSTRVIVFNFRL